ncbi:MAG: hypothetical protein WBC54_23810 [Rhodococcus sp. (in: high G+C Gram-positive bacteria)]
MTLNLDPAIKDALQDAKAWPFEEARRLIKRLDKLGKKDPESANRPVIFETGYGPSGLPHIGTFGEVARTSMVRHAFHALTDGQRKTRLICFSDDMDGLRKVPTNVPNQELLSAALDEGVSAMVDAIESETRRAALPGLKWRGIDAALRFLPNVLTDRMV